MTAPTGHPLVVHGWTVFAHPLFLATLESLVAEVATLQRKDPVGYRKKNASKRLAALRTLVFDTIPQNPLREEYPQGGSLGERHKHWFRAKFFRQYRLFFRFHTASRIIVFGWVNDDDTRRAYGSTTDAYRVFRGMLESGHPPDDWDALLVDARAQGRRLLSVAGPP